MEIAVYATAVAAAGSVADALARILQQDPSVVLGLPTGHTSIEVYRALVERHRQGRADLRRATIFNLDEFVGIPGRDPRSYAAFMHRHLFAHVNLPASRAHIPNGAAKDLQREAARYDHAILSAGGLGLVVVGIGRNGHVGFNEPATSLRANTHIARLHSGTRRDNAGLFGGRVADVPTHAVAMGMGAILGARIVVLIATGKSKAAIVRRALDGPITTRVPASLLQAHPNVVVALDKDAASKLTRQKEKGKSKNKRLLFERPYSSF